MQQDGQVKLLDDGTYKRGYLHLDKDNFWEFVTRGKDGKVGETIPLPDLPIPGNVDYKRTH